MNCAGSEEESVSSAHRMAELVRTLKPGFDFTTDEYDRNVWLTDAGLDRMEKALGCGSLHSEENRTLHAELNCALHAEVLLHRDVDYIVREGEIQLVDEFTGRVVLDRHWPDGLQSALEAKEWLELRPEGRILASMPLQHFLRSYPRLCGMTGEQGVLIPMANVPHLMLRKDLVQAVRKKEFRIWAVATVEDGIEVLTGLKAGARVSDGAYTSGSVFRRADDRLAELAEMAREFKVTDHQ